MTGHPPTGNLTRIPPPRRGGGCEKARALSRSPHSHDASADRAVMATLTRRAMNRPANEKPRLLVFVIAYHAEMTLRSVLERIPPAVFRDYRSEVLVVDDASADRTFAIGVEYQRSHPEIAMTVLRNEYNQGYGGNQKVGYAFAIVARLRLRRHDPRRRPVRARRAPAPPRAAPPRRGRRCLRQPHDGPLRRPQGRDAALQVRRQQGADHGAERDARHAPLRVPQRLSHLLGRDARAHPVSPQLGRLPLRHRDHHPALQRAGAHRRAADPHVLRRRDLPRRTA